MAKTHYCGIDYPNESDNNTYYTPTVCGLEYCESPMTDKEHEVTCKNCLRVLAKHKLKAKAALPLQRVSNSVCYSIVCGNNEGLKCKHGDYDCSARQTDC